MPWLGGRHGLPGFVPGKKVFVNITRSPVEVLEKIIRGFNETTDTGLSSIPSLVNTVFLASIIVGLVLLSILLYAVVSGKFIFVGRRGEVATTPRRKSVPGTLEGVYRVYKYTGLRRVIRELYLRFLDKLVEIGVVVKPGYTPREVARAAKDFIGEKGFKVAYLYEDLMYSRRYPGKEDVERFKEATGVDRD